jgi:hypothetical protein
MRKTMVSAPFDRSRAAIEKLILAEIPQTAEEIDIEAHYTRSTMSLGKYVTLDWAHMADIGRLQQAIISYFQDATRRRPLNIIMFAEPGSGKSHFIRCLAQSIPSMKVMDVSFNMGTLQSMEDLVHPLESIRNLKVIDELPILFLDEFDGNPANYALLLPLLWDGELHIGHRDLKVGKVVIIMAGSDPEIKKFIQDGRRMEQEAMDRKEDAVPRKKLIDLLSRVNGGYFEIPDLDNRRADKVCLTISLLQERFGPDLELVPWALLRFIAFNRFRYGVRSIAHTIDLIPLEARTERAVSLQALNFPFGSVKELKSSSLVYHLIAEDGPDSIVEIWKEIVGCQALVHIHSEHEEDGEVRKA